MIGKHRIRRTGRETPKQVVINKKETTVQFVTRQNRETRRAIKFGRALIVGGIMVVGVKTLPVHAGSEAFPGTVDQFINDFGVVAEGGCANPVFHEGPGYEIHDYAIDVHDGESDMLALTFDIPRNALIWGATPYGLTPNSGGKGLRFVAYPGQHVVIWSPGDCAHGITIWPGWPQEPYIPDTGVATTAAYVQPSSAPVQAAPTTNSLICLIDANSVSINVGGGTWTVVSDSNNTGWKWRAPTGPDGKPQGMNFHLPTGNIGSAHLDTWDGTTANSLTSAGPTSTPAPVFEASYWDDPSCNP